jgi:hypothetical protein
MIEPVYVPYKQYGAAKMRCGLDSRIYGIKNCLMKLISIWIQITEVTVTVTNSNNSWVGLF